AVGRIKDAGRLGADLFQIAVWGRSAAATRGHTLQLTFAFHITLLLCWVPKPGFLEKPGFWPSPRIRSRELRRLRLISAVPLCPHITAPSPAAVGAPPAPAAPARRRAGLAAADRLDQRLQRLAALQDRLALVPAKARRVGHRQHRLRPPVAAAV